jgi:hypothetical protein
MRKRARGPAKFTRRAKIATSAFAFASVLGLWNAIGHVEARTALAQNATNVGESQAVSMLRQQLAEQGSAGEPVLVLPPGFTAADLAAMLQSGQPIQLGPQSTANAGLPAALRPLPSASGLSSAAPAFRGRSRSFGGPAVRRSRSS